MNDVLALIGDAALLAGLRSVAAAADRKLAEETTLPNRRAWLDAGLVVVDRDEALACAAALPRRSGIVLVCPGAPGLDEWQAAATVGAEHVLGLPDDEVELLAVLGAAAEPEAGEALWSRWSVVVAARAPRRSLPRSRGRPPRGVLPAVSSSSTPIPSARDWTPSLDSKSGSASDGRA